MWPSHGDAARSYFGRTEKLLPGNSEEQRLPTCPLQYVNERRILISSSASLDAAVL